MNYHILTALSLGLRLSDLESIPARTEVELHKEKYRKIMVSRSKKIILVTA